MGALLTFVLNWLLFRYTVMFYSFWFKSHRKFILVAFNISIFYFLTSIPKKVLIRCLHATILLFYFIWFSSCGLSYRNCTNIIWWVVFKSVAPSPAHPEQKLPLMGNEKKLEIFKKKLFHSCPDIRSDWRKI